MFFLLLSRFRRSLLLISFCENAHTKALRRGNLLFAAAKLSFAPTKPLFAPTKPSFAAAKQNASDSKSLKKKGLARGRIAATHRQTAKTPRAVNAKRRPKKLPANDLAKRGAAKASVKVFLPLPLIFIFLSLPLPYVNGPCKFCTYECPLHCGLWRDDRWWKQLCSRPGAHRQEASPLGI